MFADGFCWGILQESYHWESWEVADQYDVLLVLNSKMSVPICSHGRDGRSGCSIGNFCCVGWCLWQVGHPFTIFLMSFVIPGQNIASLASNRHLDSPWCPVCRRSLQGLWSFLLWGLGHPLALNPIGTSSIPIILGDTVSCTVAIACIQCPSGGSL